MIPSSQNADGFDDGIKLKIFNYLSKKNLYFD